MSICNDAPILSLSGITKRFAGVTANKAVDFNLHRGEIVGLLGENGAGKTTLMNVVFGLYRPDEGAIRISGEPASIGNTADAIALGIGMVHQHSHAVGRHTVLENLMAGLPGRYGLLDRRSALKRLSEIGDAYGLRLDPDRLVGSLAVGERQRLDIIRALLRQARVLILDEPTSVLTPQETEGLFAALRALKADKVGIVFISHKLNEVRAITDRVVVMRRGEVVAAVANDGKLTNLDLASLMCGHEPERVVREPREQGETRLSIRKLRLDKPKLEKQAGAPIDLDIHAGEIVGIAGVSGNGQVRFAETVGGVETIAEGEIRLNGKPIGNPSPRRMQAEGLAYIPEDRIGAGLVGALPVEENLVLSRFTEAPFARHGWLDWRAIKDFATRQIAAYDVRPPDPQALVGLLSGGNQQKAIVARELAFSPRILVIAQPTRGLDVTAIAFVHRALMNLRDQGCAIMLISDDLDELFQLSDRIAVMYESEIVCDVPIEEATIATIGLAMNGGTKTRGASA
ncbi:simple sugar transport system ATP-binding protein [Mycoplana sp. BE70]|uniref:ABC transporter ATP-binding protein n=1 Tax=Mycoplana sp. BE70 TaxID=2817775 RepID=UPI00286305D3|nr:ABC transporter ATP-binding protein [Mycoplana sp. BE70]MDR6755129.1 simple sugar transport system ATP-binding protein [Mycoplana sp. BE70]